jgi:hypothetical protein
MFPAFPIEFMETISRRFLTKELAVVYAMALLKLLLHLFTNSQYGLHRDELYQKCGRILKCIIDIKINLSCRLSTGSYYKV